MSMIGSAVNEQARAWIKLYVYNAVSMTSQYIVFVRSVARTASRIGTYR